MHTHAPAELCANEAQASEHARERFDDTRYSQSMRDGMLLAERARQAGGRAEVRRAI